MKTVLILCILALCHHQLTCTENLKDNIITRAKQANEVKAECTTVPLELRFDCYPEAPVTQQTCEARGCCYDSTLANLQERKHPDMKAAGDNITIANPPGLPICFFPSDYVSYRFTNVSQGPMGLSGTLVRNSSSGFPNDITQLQIDFLHESDSRIRIRIYDPLNARYEAIFPEVPVVSTPAQNPLYSVTIDEARGTFAVLRTDNNATLFDTRNAGPLIFSDQFLQLSSHLSSNYIYGLGQHLDGLNLDTNWLRRFLWNYDTGPKPDTNLYGSHPFYLNFESDGKIHGVFLWNSNAMDIILQPSPAISFRPFGGILDLYIFVGPTPSDVLQQYTDVVGKPFLPPYWSLGYHQCRYDYYTTNRTRQVWQQTRDAAIPYDVQWNDIDYMDIFKDFTVDPVNYAGLAEFVDDVHSVGMHYIIMTDPGLDADDPPGSYFPYDNATAEGIFVMDSNGNEFIGKTWCIEDTAFPDFTNLRAHELWEEYLRRFMDELEFDGVWLDMNEPANFDNQFEACNFSNPLNNPPYLPPNSEQHNKWLFYRQICLDAKHKEGVHYDLHNLYGALETVATSNAIKNIRQKRPFVISRSSYPGHGKYAGHWTGDTHSSWPQLRKSIFDVLNFNLFGIPMVGADICGFGENTTVHLCTRWYQVGAFYPFARNHNNEFCIPQDPVSLGEPVISSARNSLTQRYLLLPYLYSLFFRSHLTGEPVMKPLFFEFWNEPQTYTMDLEFLWGEALLFTPIVFINDETVDAYFPTGLWYNWYNGSLSVQSDSGVTVTVQGDPVFPIIFARGGFIVPTQTPEVTTTESRLNPFQLAAFLDIDGNAKGELYWDDGENTETVSLGEYNWITFNVSNNVLESQVRVAGYTSEAMPLSEISIAGVSSFTSCLLNGVPYTCDYDQTLQVLKFSNIAAVSLMDPLTCSWI